MAFLESIFGNPNEQPNALMRFGAALEGPDAQRVLLEQQKLNLAKQKENQLQDLISKAGAVPMDGSMGPQQPLPPKQFLMQLAGITGDAGGLASYLVSEREQEAERERQKQIASILRGSNLQNLAVPQATAGASSGSNPLSVRNNNPGNMRPVGASEGFQQFENPQAGMEAMQNDLAAKIMGQSSAMKERFGEGYLPTLSNVITTWAPPEENDTQAYINFVSQKTGIAPDQPLTIEDIAKIQPAMIEQEGGSAASQFFGAQPNTQGASQEPEYMSQLAQLAQIDPKTYGDDYLSAKVQAEQERVKSAKEERELKLKEAQGIKEDAKALTEGEGTLRKEFEGLADVKQFRDVEGAYQRVLKATANPSAAGDIALIFNYMKMLDPGSTVREGEFATAQTAAGIPTQIWNTYNKALKGERLAPEQRTDFLNQAQGQYQAAEDLFNVRADQYQNLASSYKYNPQRIVTRARGKKPETKAVSWVVKDGKLVQQ